MLRQCTSQFLTTYETHKHSIRKLDSITALSAEELNEVNRLIFLLNCTPVTAGCQKLLLCEGKKCALTSVRYKWKKLTKKRLVCVNVVKVKLRATCSICGGLLTRSCSVCSCALGNQLMRNCPPNKNRASHDDVCCGSSVPTHSNCNYSLVSLFVLNRTATFCLSSVLKMRFCVLFCTHSEAFAAAHPLEMNLR